MTLAALALIVLAAAPPSAASDTVDSTPPPVRAARLTGPVTVDGVLDEPIWQTAEPASRFLQRDPVEGVAPSQRSEVRIAYDDDAIYVGARLWDTAPDSILKRLSRRDVSIPADRFSIYLDPYHDRRSGYYFLINAAGTLFDGTVSNDGWEDGSWDGVWEGKAHVDDKGWTAEMRIPYSQLRFQSASHLEWGVNFRRVIQRHNEEDFLVYQPKNGSGFVSRFPVISGMDDVHPGRSIELRPYVTTKAEYLRHAPLDPFNDGSRYSPNVGGDLRMSLGSRLTLNATANPDFGQVEVDPAVVNLSDVESYFQEKRPFFVEGSQNFRFGNEGANDYWGFNWPEPTFFYSRRIGRNPQGSLPDDADYVNEPVGTRILGAAKLTGKLSPTINFGTLHALTGREMADIETGGIRSQFEVEPASYYGAVRGQKEFARRQYGLGAMTTLVTRSFDGGTLRDQLSGQSLMSGLDGWAFLDKDQKYVISGWSAMTYVHGTKARITALQQDSRHYFQRPDVAYLGVDPNATSLTGYGSRYWLNKQKGRVLLNSAIGFMSPGFEVNDIGFESRADVVNAHFGTGYKWTNVTKHRKFQDVLGAVFGSTDTHGDLVSAGTWLQGSTEFSNNYSWNYHVSLNPRTLNNRRTRGGPLTVNLPAYGVGTYFDTDGKSKLFYFAETGFERSQSGTWDTWFNPGVEWKPVSNVWLRLGPTYSRVHEDAQYVGAGADPAASLTYGQRYVFATLDQTEVGAEVRLNWAFSPDLCLQVYAQPLVSHGNYWGYKQLARARSYEFQPLSGVPTYDPVADQVDLDGPGGNAAFNPDFDFKSLRGNAVLRWEYRPGSTLFLVWTQERVNTDGYSQFDLQHSFDRLLTTKPNNILLAKVTYYFNV